MMGSNTPMPSPIGQDRAGPAGVSREDFHAAALGHATYMDERNIDVQIIGPRPFLVLGWMEPHLLPAWTRYVNDMIHQQCQMFPDRFLGAAMLPQASDAPDLSGCLDELNRCVKELGIPLIVHGTNALDPRYRVVPHNYQLGFLTEQYLAGQFLSHGDAFSRFPELRVIICHCGGALDRFIPTDHHIAQKDLSENLFYDTCGYDLNFLEAAIKQRGVPRMLFGTEAPGSGRAVRPETGRTSDDLVPVISSLDFLSEMDKIRIFNENPARVVPALAKIR